MRSPIQPTPQSESTNQTALRLRTRSSLGLTTQVRRASLLVLCSLAAGFGWIPPVLALPSGSTTPGQERALECLGEIQASLTASPSTINLGQSVSLRWDATVPSGCGMVGLRLDSTTVPTTGSRSLQPIADTTYILRAVFGNSTRTLATRTVRVILPQTVTINSSFQKPLLLQALRTPNTTVIVQNHVDMDLTSWNGFALHDIPIASGVILRGGRTSNVPGPRLFTAQYRTILFNIQGDGVRITGMRIQGPEMGVGDGDSNLARGIFIPTSTQKVEIDHNELSGFSKAAIQIDNGNREGFATPGNIHIHNNYIHHNQHVGGQGYGVAVGDGAYVTIQRNVFDWNRHAIAGDGSNGSGYVANENLILPNGGLHRWIPFPGFWTHTHQFDMHGQENCGVGDIFSDAIFNCGTAGESVYIRRNTFLYTEDEAIKLRGTPQLHPYGMFVEGNVFAHEDPDDAISQTESGLWVGADNLFGFDGSADLGSGDFDADGVTDAFMATGATWWFSSSGTQPWTFLRASPYRLDQLSLGDFDGDRRCDVRVGNTVYSGGTIVRSVRPINGVIIGTLSR